MNDADIYRITLDHLDGGNRWCKGVSVAADGRMCILGALRGSTTFQYEPLARRLADLALELHPDRCTDHTAHWLDVTLFNDHSDTTFEDVALFLKHAIYEAELLEVEVLS